MKSIEGTTTDFVRTVRCKNIATEGRSDLLHLIEHDLSIPQPLFVQIAQFSVCFHCVH